MTKERVRQRIAASLCDSESDLLARSILGTAHAGTIVSSLDDCCRKYLGCHIADCVLCELSVGAAFGLRLDDGRTVFLKVHHPSHVCDSLRAVYHVQHALAEKGFPCPQVILPPVPFGTGFVVVQEFVDAGEHRDAHDPAVRHVMATTLARLFRETEEFQGIPGLPKRQLPPNSLWPTPHNALFDFERTATGAEWIDEIAKRTRETLSSPLGRIVLGHADWSVKHFRFAGSKVRVIYDWDSLVLENELVLVGMAAATFPATWYLDVRRTPTPAEAEQFVRDYENARGVPFTQAERKHIAATATYAMAYTARCEHALDPDVRNYGDSFREALVSARECDYIRFENVSRRTS